MKVQREFEGLALGPGEERLFERRLDRLARLARVFRPELVHLRVVVRREGKPTAPRYEGRFVLKTPPRVIETRAEAGSVAGVLQEGFEELTRRLQEVKAKLRGEHLWKRKARREKLRLRNRAIPFVPMEEGPPARRAETREILDHLDALWNRARREIAILLATGDLDPARADVADVIDAAVVRAVEEWEERPPEISLELWLWSLVREEILRLVAESRARRAARSLEEDVPETPEEIEVSTLGDEILDFWQPDEDLRLEDVVDDPTLPLPEEVAERDELGRVAVRILAGLPREWRESFLLYAADGRSPEEISWLTGQSVEEVRQNIREARSFLRAKLLESGRAVPAAAGAA